MITFGPIPSRRLGRSLGVNNIPPKICSYSCIYCQVGLTDSMSVTRRNFFSMEEIFTEVCKKVEELKASNEVVDYITFVPDGEPTLDINLGKTIERLKPLGIKIAVISNASLIWDDEVKNDLMKADWVSLKIDSGYSNIWRKINRPHGLLNIDKIINGAVEFASKYSGTLVTETMLVDGINDGVESLNKTACLIKRINPDKAYILTPTRPPAENKVKPPSAYKLDIARQVFGSLLPDVNFITEFEGTDFSFQSDVQQELLSILAVHPMREDAVKGYLAKTNADWGVVESLIADGKVQSISYGDHIFFMRNAGVKV